jgi:uncharacterized repeat protein (TIGR03837 family)
MLEKRMIKSVDIFCVVIDNYGDIGVCWRLARQMAIEHNMAIRLYVDDMDSFKTIIPAPDSEVEIVKWDVTNNHYIAPDVVIEGFACNLPQQVIQSMVQKKSIWIDLEYLTAEDWAMGCHCVPSIHPTTGLQKTLFFPGFDEVTGGLIRESDLIPRRNAFLNDKIAQNIWRKDHFIPEIDENIIDISLFCYKTVPIDDLLAGLSHLNKKIRIFRPVKDRHDKKITSFQVEIIDIPFLSQYDYDYLLWTSHINFVRGEDSFVRAQFAGKPFIWNIYVQDKNAHFIKMNAFLERIKPFYNESDFESLANLHDLWNEGDRNTTKTKKDLWLSSLPSLLRQTSSACAWANHLVSQKDLCTRILEFAQPKNRPKIYR